MKLNYEWRRKRETYTNGSRLLVNGLLVASYDWNSSYAKGEPHAAYTGRYYLPGLIHAVAKGENTTEIQARMERTVNTWLQKFTSKGG